MDNWRAYLSAVISETEKNLKPRFGTGSSSDASSGLFRSGLSTSPVRPASQTRGSVPASNMGDSDVAIEVLGDAIAPCHSNPRSQLETVRIQTLQTRAELQNVMSDMKSAFEARFAAADKESLQLRRDVTALNTQLDMQTHSTGSVCPFYTLSLIACPAVIEQQGARIHGEVVAELNRRLRAVEEQDLPRQIVAASDSISQTVNASLVRDQFERRVLFRSLMSFFFLCSVV